MRSQSLHSTRRKVLSGLVALAASSIYPLESLASDKQKTTYQTTNFSQDSDEVLLARMLFGEARDRSELEKVAIAYTAINRSQDRKKWNGESLREAMLKPYQYSCFNYNDSNRKKLMNPEKYEPQAFQECLNIARKVLAGKYRDPTNGATHYYNPDVMSKPSWANKMQKIGRIKISEKEFSKHEFYREF
ncbi:cell wall hydrolase [Candidatus Pacearchaeota archaeon]|nr:cell wall hydrolase [Candidatus Pacearchaeota archaeon]